jgi:hypothetical protein
MYYAMRIGLKTQFRVGGAAVARVGRRVAIVLTLARCGGLTSSPGLHEGEDAAVGPTDGEAGAIPSSEDASPPIPDASPTPDAPADAVALEIEPASEQDGAADTSTVPSCGAWGQACCANDACEGELSCRTGICRSVANDGTGQPCALEIGCMNGPCIAVGDASVCSAGCLSDGDCIAGWSCVPAIGPSGPFGFDECQCTPSLEVCDGKDNDCDGIVDDSSEGAALCPSGQICEDGACGCASQCGAACVDVSSDPDNCGTCGLHCAGSCAMGRCIVTLVKAAGAQYDIAVNASQVIWGDTDLLGGGINEVALAGGPSVSLAPGQDVSHGIAIDASDVYWTHAELETVMKAPLVGGAAVALGPGRDYGIAVDDVNVYFIQVDDTTCARSIVSVGKQSGALTVLVSNLGQANGIATDGQKVYWANTDTGEIMEVPVDGSSLPDAIATGQAGPFAIALDAMNIYWVNYNSGQIMQRALGAAPSVAPTQLAVDDPNTEGIAVDESSVYFTNPTTGQVKKVAMGGGPQTPLAKNQAGPMAIAVDSTSVYWANSSSGGSIMRLTPK